MGFPSRLLRREASCLRTYCVISGVKISPCFAPARATRILLARSFCADVIFDGVLLDFGALPATFLRKSKYSLARACKSAAICSGLLAVELWPSTVPASKSSSIPRTTIRESFRRELLIRIGHRQIGSASCRVGVVMYGVTD